MEIDNEDICCSVWNNIERDTYIQPAVMAVMYRPYLTPTVYTCTYQEYNLEYFIELCCRSSFFIQIEELIWCYIHIKPRVFHWYKNTIPKSTDQSPRYYTLIQSKLYGRDGSISGILSIPEKLSAPVKTNWLKTKSSAPHVIANGFPTGLDIGLPNRGEGIIWSALRSSLKNSWERPRNFWYSVRNCTRG